MSYIPGPRFERIALASTDLRRSYSWSMYGRIPSTGYLGSSKPQTPQITRTQSSLLSDWVRRYGMRIVAGVRYQGTARNDDTSNRTLYMDFHINGVLAGSRSISLTAGANTSFDVKVYGEFTSFQESYTVEVYLWADAGGCVYIHPHATYAHRIQPEDFLGTRSTSLVDVAVFPARSIVFRLEVVWWGGYDYQANATIRFENASSPTERLFEQTATNGWYYTAQSPQTGTWAAVTGDIKIRMNTSNPDYPAVIYGPFIYNRVLL